MRGAHPSDEELIRAFQDGGDRQALNQLAGRHWGRVRAMIYAMVLNDADADELAQDVFVRAIRGLGRFRGEARFSSWLCRVAINTARTFLARRRPAAGVDECPGEPVDRRGSTPDQWAAARELDVRITEAMQSLSPPLRAAIVLTVLEGASVRDAARIENCPVATMYWRVHKARRLLEKRLARHLT